MGAQVTLRRRVPPRDRARMSPGALVVDDQLAGWGTPHPIVRAGRTVSSE